jgi:hypothetical protein
VSFTAALRLVTNYMQAARKVALNGGKNLAVSEPLMRLGFTTDSTNPDAADMHFVLPRKIPRVP